MGELKDVGRGGIRLTLAHDLPEGEVVQVHFPRKSDSNRPDGRMIIGHVVHSKPDLGRHVVRIAFGWDTAVGTESRPVRKHTKSPSLLRPLSRRLSALVASAWNGR